MPGLLTLRNSCMDSLVWNGASYASSGGFAYILHTPKALIHVTTHSVARITAQRYPNAPDCGPDNPRR